jgi:hypothetical protein
MIKERYPRIEHRPQQTDEVPEHLASMAAALETLLASIGNTVSREDIDDYNARLSKFYREYGEYLTGSIHHQNLERRAIKLSVFIVNDGSAPAEDVDVFMHFPDGFRLTDEEGFPKPPRPPKPPEKPRTRLEKQYDSITGSLLHRPDLTLPVVAPIGPAPNVSAPTIKKTNGYDVGFHVQRLKHKLQEPAESLYVIFDSFETVESFHIDYEILAANVPDEVTGQLHVVVEKE